MKASTMKKDAMMVRLLVVAGLGFGLALQASGSFYTQDRLFSTRPDEHATLTSIERFGPVGLSIELHQPAFVMVIGNVEEGSPAAATGRLTKGQIIETINGAPLSDIDPRIQLGNIITQAEATDGMITLVVRDAPGTPTQTVDVRIPVLGSYSATWPLDCEKSNRIVRDLADWTARQSPGITYAGGLRMLFLLSTGEEQDLAVVREWVHRLIANNRDGVSGSVNWHLGYGSIPLAEYYLRTGDEAVLPLIQHAVDAAKRNYMPGGWSTRGRGNWHYMAGARINAAGLHVATFLLLAKECGVEVDEDMLLGALRQFIRFAGRGNVAYGDQRPERGYTDNGKNGALGFTLAAAAALMPDGEDSVYAKARDMAASRGFYSTHTMLHGHTGGGIGEAWRSAAMGLMHEKEPQRYRSFMDNRTWFYEMSRRFDGSFGILGGRRYDNTDWGIGMGLTYTVPRQTLRISGAPPTPYSQQYVLPAQIWGTAADNDFYSLVPAQPAQGEAPDVQSERIDGESGLVIQRRIASGDEAVIRKYIHHPDPELRRLAAHRMGDMPALVLEALESGDARVRFAGVLAIQVHGHLLTDQTTPILLRMIHDPEESWWVADCALQALRHADPDVLKPHTDRLLYWAQHEDWWMSRVAIELVLPLAAAGHAVEEILPAVGRMIAQNRRYQHWHPRMLTENFENAAPEVQEVLLGMLSTTYQAWPVAMPEVTVQDPVHPQSEEDFMGRIAQAMAPFEGGLERLFHLSQQRYPDKALAHRNVFLNNQEQLDDNPDMQARVRDLTREELIPEFVVENAYDLLVRLDTVPRSGRDHFRFTNAERRMIELISLYQRAGIDDYNWHDYGPERTEMEWWYHTFDPEEQLPVGQERARSSYREVTYPAGMEDWNQPEFDAAAAGWERGLAPFSHLNGEKRAFGNRCNRHEGRGLDFCGCAEPPNTFWENEVLLKAGVFEIPLFEEGYVYRILYGGASHVGYGDGTHIYVNGRQIHRNSGATPARRGAEPMGARVTTERWGDFESGRVHIAAKSFLSHRGDRYGNYMTVFMRRMKLPPLRDELYRGLQLVGLRNAEWQELQDPDSDIDPNEDLYSWDGEVRRNAEAIGSWNVMDEVQEIRDFDPNARQRPSRGWNPPLVRIELSDDLRTGEPLLVWTGSMLLDAGSKQALAAEIHTIDEKPFLFVERGGFSPDHESGWTSPWLVFEKE